MKNIAIVTGASSGIGKQFFNSVLDRADGIDEIWVVARGEEKLKELAKWHFANTKKILYEN